MAYFARKLRGGVHDGDTSTHFFALVEIAKRRGGKPIGFVLYRRVAHHAAMRNRFTEIRADRIEMIYLKAATAEEAIRRFWPLERGEGKEFPGYKSVQWKKTTGWLDCLVFCGWCEQFRSTWAKVGRSSPRAKSRKKKPLQFGNISHVLLVRRARVSELEEEIPSKLLRSPLRPEEVEAINREIKSARTAVSNVMDEMRHKRFYAGKPPRGIVREDLIPQLT